MHKSDHGSDDGMPTQNTAEQAVTGRRSVRRFLPRPVPMHVVTRILDGAARAPSGTNTQPWLVHVVTGAARDRLSAAVLAAVEAGERTEEYAYSPKELWEPYISRRRKVGFDLYALYGIDRKDMAGRRLAAMRNYSFFGAPVGLFFTMDRKLLHGSWIDVGMFMQNVMTLARAHGLETCPQQAWCEFGATVRRELSIPDTQILISGMALGHEDVAAKVNSLITERVPASEFTRFHDR